MGSMFFKKVQYGKEATRGTAVAATKRFLGDANIPQDRDIQMPEFALGARVNSHLPEVTQILADPVTLSMDDGYYQALPALLGIFLKGGVTASEQTASQQDYL